MTDEIGSLFTFAQKIAAGIAVILVAFFLARAIKKAVYRLINRFEWSGQIGTLFATTASYAILAVGAMIGVSIMGIDVTPVLATLGLGGFALGFALRDAVANLLAGLMIIIYRPFSNGDYIAVAGDGGKVEEINLRYTVLINEEGKTLVPNQMIISKTVKIKKRE